MLAAGAFLQTSYAVAPTAFLTRRENGEDDASDLTIVGQEGSEFEGAFHDFLSLRGKIEAAEGISAMKVATFQNYAGVPMLQRRMVAHRRKLNAKYNPGGQPRRVDTVIIGDSFGSLQIFEITDTRLLHFATIRTPHREPIRFIEVFGAGDQPFIAIGSNDIVSLYNVSSMNPISNVQATIAAIIITWCNHTLDISSPANLAPFCVYPNLSLLERCRQ